MWQLACLAIPAGGWRRGRPAGCSSRAGDGAERARPRVAGPVRCGEDELPSPFGGGGRVLPRQRMGQGDPAVARGEVSRVERFTAFRCS